MSEARLILTCGLPGAGKTPLARRLAADRSAVRLTKDEWLWALGSTPWDEPTREKIEGELWRLAQETLRLGLSVVLDFGLWARSERDEMRHLARGLGVGVELHYLDTPTGELRWSLVVSRTRPARQDRGPGTGIAIGRGPCGGWGGCPRVALRSVSRCAARATGLDPLERAQTPSTDSSQCNA